MKVVAFIGLDGSGKTTQSTLFAEKRKAEGIDAVYDHQFRFNSNGAMNLKAKLRPILLLAQGAVCQEGTVAMAPNADDAAKRGKFRQTIQKILLIPPLVFSVLFLGLFRTWNKRRKNRHRKLLVLDRYFFDELVRIEWKLGLRLPFRNLLLRLSPQPDLVVYFDIPGEVSWQRMDPQDSSQDAMRRKESIYKEWLPLIAKRMPLRQIIITKKSVEEVQEQVEEESCQFKETMHSSAVEK